MTVDPVRAIADAVLYEGYILWPYRRSALKNQRRFTFGGVFPPAHTQSHPDDPCSMRAEVLLWGQGEVEVTVRFLQIVQRTVLGPDGAPVDERIVDGARFQSWEEAVEREAEGPGPIAIPAGAERDGFMRRSWARLAGEVEVRSTPVRTNGLRRVRVSVHNRTRCAARGSRHEALTCAFCSTHMLLRAAPGGSFVSSTDPPAELTDEAAGCRNVGCWPVLVGEPGRTDTMLASPIILEDHPRIAPESPGDMFDGGEIDQLLVLNILALTDEEKTEMAACDPRAAEILSRVERLEPEQLMALHGRTALR
ncbi:MAG TPA: hypothetical protein VJU80_12080 [Solirubrobacteraceae bacterium]|nr:hypothetical protein [Solirubrobacteraceae bacterium]